MSDNDSTVRITLRIPADLHESLTKAAAKDNRSMNAEIIQRLEATLDPNFEMIHHLSTLTTYSFGESEESSMDFIGLLEEMMKNAHNVSALSSTLYAIATTSKSPKQELPKPPDFPFPDIDD